MTWSCLILLILGENGKVEDGQDCRGVGDKYPKHLITNHRTECWDTIKYRLV